MYSARGWSYNAFREKRTEISPYSGVAPRYSRNPSYSERARRNKSINMVDVISVVN